MGEGILCNFLVYLNITVCWMLQIYSSLRSVLPKLKAAVQRSVVVHLLWAAKPKTVMNLLPIINSESPKTTYFNL